MNGLLRAQSIGMSKITCLHKCGTTPTALSDFNEGTEDSSLRSGSILPNRHRRFNRHLVRRNFVAG